MSKNKNPYCFLNGSFIKETDAEISVNDIGLHRSYGVFDVLRTYNGKPFLLKEHLDRLFNSAKEINLKIPYSGTEIGKYIYTLLNKNNNGESLIKILVTGGESPDGITPGKKATFIIFAKEMQEPKAKLYEKGVKLVSFEFERALPSIKTLNYIQLIKSGSLLKKEKAFSLLYISKGKVLECATCNIFIFKKNKLMTPKSGILKGITRNFVIELANDIFDVQQKAITTQELLNSNESFVTVSTKGIVPVVKVDKFKIGNGKPGKNTKTLMEKFNRKVAGLSGKQH